MRDFWDSLFGVVSEFYGLFVIILISLGFGPVVKYCHIPEVMETYRTCLFIYASIWGGLYLPIMISAAMDIIGSFFQDETDDENRFRY